MEPELNFDWHPDLDETTNTTLDDVFQHADELKLQSLFQHLTITPPIQSRLNEAAYSYLVKRDNPIFTLALVRAGAVLPFPRFLVLAKYQTFLKLVDYPFTNDIKRRAYGPALMKYADNLDIRRKLYFNVDPRNRCNLVQDALQECVDYHLPTYTKTRWDFFDFLFSEPIQFNFALLPDPPRFLRNYLKIGPVPHDVNEFPRKKNEVAFFQSLISTGTYALDILPDIYPILLNQLAVILRQNKYLRVKTYPFSDLSNEANQYRTIQRNFRSDQRRLALLCQYILPLDTKSLYDNLYTPLLQSLNELDGPPLIVQKSIVDNFKAAMSKEHLVRSYYDKPKKISFAEE